MLRLNLLVEAILGYTCGLILWSKSLRHHCFIFHPIPGKPPQKSFVFLASFYTGYAAKVLNFCQNVPTSRARTLFSHTTSHSHFVRMFRSTSSTHFVRLLVLFAYFSHFFSLRFGFPFREIQIISHFFQKCSEFLLQRNSDV